MSRKKYSKEFKLSIIREREQGASFYSLERKYNLNLGLVRRWYAAYLQNGEDALEKKNSNYCCYSAEFKNKVVASYLAGEGSFLDIAVKYGINAQSTVLKWVKQYNNHEDLTDSRSKGDSFMATNPKSRKTTLEERIAIVEHCTAHSNNYKLTAMEFSCSYGQVYSWVKKYNSQGVEGLYDRRGRNKPEEELTELEKLQTENRMLKAQAKQQQMEIDFLKKLDAVERR